MILVAAKGPGELKGEPSCPRCGASLRPPGLMSSVWQCETHGGVLPQRLVEHPSIGSLGAVVHRSVVPVWLPWPLPNGWVFTGLAYAADEHEQAHAVALACTGPSPLGGPGELVLVAEEMGVGMGARYAGLDGADPGPIFEDTVAHAKLYASGRPTAMWCVPDTGDRAVFVGEALGLWLWAVLWPETTGHLMYDEVVLTDLREAGAEIELLPVGALSPRLSR